jgi:hypothetical protein
LTALDWDRTAYELSRGNGGWTEIIIYSFNRGTARLTSRISVNIALGPMARVPSGHARAGGCGYQRGRVYKLSPSKDGRTHTLLYRFTNGSQGPTDDLAVDSGDNVYATTLADGAYNNYNVFKLTNDFRSWLLSTSTSVDFKDGTDANNGISPSTSVG